MRNKLYCSRLGRLLTIVLLLALLNGCSLEFAAVDALIRAPKMRGRYAALESAFEASVGSNVKLKSPRSGEYRTAYVLYDYDADMTDEVLVFYTSAQDEMTVRIHFLDYVDGEWISVADETGRESEVQEVQFRDLDGNNTPEIIIIYNKKNSNRILSVYTVSTATTEKTFSVTSIAAIQCSNYLLIDMDADGVQEIVYTTFETAAESGLQIPHVKVLGNDRSDSDSQYSVLASFAIMNDVTAFVALTSDKLKEQTRVYIDCMCGSETAYMTQVVTWNPEKGYHLLIDEQIMSQAFVVNRFNRIVTSDVDADGLAEIPEESEIPLTETVGLPADVHVFLLQRRYYKVDADGNHTQAYIFYIDPLNEYRLDLLPLGLYDRISVTYEHDIRNSRFYLYDAQTQSRGEELFCVRVELTASGGLACYFDVTQAGSEMGLTGDTVLSSISLTSNETEVK